MTKPKILALSFLFPNSSMPNHGIFVLNRLRALQRYADVKVVNPIAWSPLHAGVSRYKPLQNVPEKETISDLEVYHPRFFSIPGHFKSIETVSYYRAVAPVVAEMAKSFAFDIVDMHWTYPDLPTGVWLANNYSRRMLLTLRGREAFYQDDGLLRAHIIKHYMKKVDRIIALSQELKMMSDSVTQDESNSFVIRNGVEVERFKFMPREAARNVLGLSHHEKIVVSVGSLIRRKGFDLIIKAFARLIKEEHMKNLRLYILGSEGPEGDFRASLHRLVDEYRLGDHIVFYGQVENAKLKTWYNAADMFCLASRGEGSPNVLTEALACGCPCVATDVGSVREIMDAEDDLGVCVPASDVDAIVDGITFLENAQIDRENNAKRFNKYSWDWCARNVSEHYQALL